MGTINATNADATNPMDMLNLPRFHGPGLNLFPTKKTRMKIGVVKATKAAHAPMLKIAPMVRLPPNINKSSKHPIPVLSQTALTGVRVCTLTCFQRFDKGKQSSRAYANVTLEAAIIQPWPIANPAMIVRDSTARTACSGRT